MAEAQKLLPSHWMLAGVGGVLFLPDPLIITTTDSPKPAKLNPDFPASDLDTEDEDRKCSTLRIRRIDMELRLLSL